MIEAVSVLYLLINTLLAALGVTYLKKGTNKHAIPYLFFTKNFLLSISLYGLGTIFYLLALFKEDLTFVFPFGALVYVWAMLFSVHVLDEKMDSIKYVALVGIVVGILLIGMGS